MYCCSDYAAQKCSSLLTVKNRIIFKKFKKLFLLVTQRHEL